MKVETGMQKTRIFISALAIFLIFGSEIGPASSTEPTEVTQVTAKNFTRSMSDIYFNKVTDAVGTNIVLHTRKTKNVDNQNIIRENRDTLYSNLVIDARNGFTLSLPATNGVFMTALIFDQETHLLADGSGDIGTYQAYAGKERVIKFNANDIPTDYAYVLFRTYSDGSSDSEKLANNLQDGIKLAAQSKIPFIAQKWDDQAVETMRQAYASRIFETAAKGTRQGYNTAENTVEDIRNVYASCCWGGQLEKYATYGTTDTLDISVKQCAVTTIEPPKVDYDRGGFWSYQVYNAEGWISSNSSTLQNTNTVLNDDGTVILRFGTKEACGTDENRADREQQFNITTRIYNPSEEIPLAGRALRFEN